MHRETFPVICVFPQASKGEFWERPLMQQLAIAELDQTAREFRIDTSREYLTGYSMGAAGSYRIAYKWPDRFTAIATGAGTVQPIPASLGADRAKIDEGTNPFTVEPDPFSALATRIKGVPTWIFHGDTDTVVSIEQSRQLVAALRAVGATVRYTEMPATTHSDGVDKMYGNVELITWLLAQRRQPRSQ
jgi:predicted peptidase